MADLASGPVFIIGCPRSGTTLLLDLLAGTQAFGYVSTVGHRDKASDALHGRTRIYDLPLLGGRIERNRRTLHGLASRLGPLKGAARRRLPTAIEPWEFWEDLIPGFRPEQGDGPAHDPDPTVDESSIDRAQSVVAALLRSQRRTVLLSKYTDFPRLRLIRAVFPDARFVHIVRDPYAVAASYATEIESGRFGTWAQREWWAAQWPTTAQEHWRTTGETMLGFAAHNRNRLVDLIDAEITATDAPVLAIGYEHLMDEPAATLRTLLDFADLESRAPIPALVASRRIVSSNDGWQKRRTGDEVALLREIFSL